MADDEIYDAGDEAQVDQRTEAQKRIDAEVTECWRAMLATYEGRAAIWEILEMCGLFRDCAPGDASDMAHFLGRRNVGLRVNARLLTVDVNSYNRMRDEAILRQQRVLSDG